MTGAVRDAAGFRLRGLDMTRIETFTDAAFAFALTLLAISLDPLTTFADLRNALRGVPAFLVSATMLMMFWWAHHEWSRRYGMDDRRTFVLSCALVFTVLVYVYPLRFMFGLMFAWLGNMAGIELGSSAGVGSYADVNTMFALYGIGFTAMSTAILLLNLHAWRHRDALELDALERHETRATIGAWLILTATGVLSTLLAVLLPPAFVGMPGWAYALLAIIMPAYGRTLDRRRPATEPAAV
jgi:uncharacterized membrane protein